MTFGYLLISSMKFCFMFGRNVTLHLSGNSRLRQVQRLRDEDILVLSKCLQSDRCVTGEQSDSTNY